MWLPDSFYQEQVDEYARDLHQTLDDWNRKLKSIDADLQLVKAHDHATAPGLKPGYWHVIRTASGVPPTVIVHEGPNGEYRDPDSGLLENLKRGDMWNDSNRRERERRIKLAKDAEDRQKINERQQIQDELRERVKAIQSPGVLIKRDL